MAAHFPWWRCLHCGCGEYEEHVFTGHMKGVPMIHCAACEVLHSAPDPNSPKALRWQIERLSGVLQAIADGDVPRRRAKQWRDDGKPSKADKCPHDRWMCEECGECIGEFAASAIEARGL